MTGIIITSNNSGSGDINDVGPLKYRQLTAQIRGWLDKGVFLPGDPVPSITALSTDRGWARQTCARALRVLADEGLLTLYPGAGYHVTKKPEQ